MNTDNVVMLPGTGNRIIMAIMNRSKFDVEAIQSLEDEPNLLTTIMEVMQVLVRNYLQNAESSPLTTQHVIGACITVMALKDIKCVSVHCHIMSQTLLLIQSEYKGTTHHVPVDMYLGEPGLAELVNSDGS